MQNFWKELKANRENLTRQQYKTLKGQAAHGYMYDARRGLQKILQKRG